MNKYKLHNEKLDMETKINIAAILKDKPQGTKLYSSACGKCKLEEVDDKSFKISFYNSKFGFMNGGEGYLDKNGKLYDDGECVDFPSKEMRNWSKFAWKKSDVLVSNDGKCKVIFERFDDDTYTSFVGKYYVECYGKNDELQDYEEEHYGDTVNYTKESEEAAQTYINTIEERLGGKLNIETLEIEKIQPEFKDGDIVSAVFTDGDEMICVFKEKIEQDYMGYCGFFSKGKHKGDVIMDLGDDCICNDSPICKEIRLATEEEKKQLFSALKKEGKRWDSENKQIVDLKQKWTPNPFDRVITRNADDDIWTANIFSHMDSHGEYVTIGCVGGYTYCIPYNDETVKLIGTTNDLEGGEQ